MLQSPQAEEVASQLPKAAEPVVDITELGPEPPSEGSEHSEERVQPVQDSLLVFDDEVDTSEADLTIDTVLDRRLQTRPAPLRPQGRRSISGQKTRDLSHGSKDFDNSLAKNDADSTTIRKVHISLPKRNSRNDSQPLSTRRTMSSETTTTSGSFVGRRAVSSQSNKALSTEERMVRAYSSLRELRMTCTLPATRERVTIHHVFDLIDKTRMRLVPHQWSLVDRRLKQVQSSAERIADFVALMKTHGSDAESVASMFYSSCELALSMQGKLTSASTALDNLLAVFHRASITIQHVRASVPEGVSSDKLYSCLSKVLQSLQQICLGFIDILDEINKGGYLMLQPFTFGQQANQSTAGSRTSSSFILQIEQYFEADLASLSLAAHQACEELWILSFKGSSDGSLGTCHGPVQDWLNGSGHGHCSHGFSRGHYGSKHGHSFVFDCVEPVVVQFFKTPSRLLLVAGDAGYGEQELVSNIIERLQLSLSLDAKLLRASVTSATQGSSSIRLLKALLSQLLDQSIGDTGLLDAINTVRKRSETESTEKTEDLLWELIGDRCSKASGNVAIVINTIDSHGTDGSSKFLAKLQVLTSKCENIRCLALADADSARSISGTQIYTLSRMDIRRNARSFMQMALSTSAILSFLSAEMKRELQKHIAERQWTSLLEAKLILRLLEAEHDLGRMTGIICKTPKTVQGILDNMLLKIDYSNPDMQSLLSWLLVGKRAIQVDEMERYGSVTMSNWLRRIRSGRSVSSNSPLASIITIRSGRIQFVDSVVQAKMHHLAIHGKIALSLNLAHRRVAIDCLEHAKKHLQQDKVDIVFQNVAQTQWATAAPYKDFDPLMAYAVRNWYEHYEKSLSSSEKLSRHLPAEVSSKMSDSVLMTLAEWHFLRSEGDSITTNMRLTKILALRKAAFGANAKSVIQTLINLAHSDLRHTISIEKLVEAFEAAILTFEDPSPQATAGAKYIISLVKPHTTLSSKSSKVYKYLWRVLRGELGESHDQTLAVAQRLAELYKAEMRFAEAAETLHDMYVACCRTRGLFASKTLDLFHVLIDALEHADDMAAAQQLCQDVFDAAPTLETWTNAALSAITRIVRHYQDRGMSSASKGALQQLWSLLQGQLNKENNNRGAILVAFTSITLQLATKLRDLSLEKEASTTLVSFWTSVSRFVTTDRRCEVATLVNLREIAQLLLRLEKNQEALSILRVLYEIHQLPSHDHFDEMLQVYSALIVCYKGVKNPIEDFLWLNILDSILHSTSGHGDIGSDTVFLCRDLAHLHRSRREWKAAISICRKSLEVLWPQVLIDGGKLHLPKTFTRERVEIAIIMAQMYRLTEQISQGDILIQSIVKCCKQSVLLWQSSSQDIALILSGALEDAGFHLEALEFWKSIVGDCRTHLGHSHSFTLHVAAAIVRLSLHLGTVIEDDDEICDCFEEEPDEDDVASIIVLIEGLLALCKSQRGKGKRESYTILLRRYERLWSYYADLRHHVSMDAARGFEIYIGYSQTLLSVGSVSIAVRLARKLRTIMLSDLGRQDIWYLKASLELTKLLEMDDTTLREAVDIYDELNEICLGLSGSDEAFIEILRLVEERLSVLMSSKPLLHDRAEIILIKSWRQCAKKYGYAHERSISSLRKVIDFWVVNLTVENKKQATVTLEEVILGVLKKETNPRKLFHLAEHFSAMYKLLGVSHGNLVFLQTIRSEIARLQQPQGLCGQAYLENKHKRSVTYDRRCLVLVYAMEELSRKKTESLFGDILTRVVAETALYEAWLRAGQQNDQLGNVLTTGSRLIQHLESYSLRSEAGGIQDALWKLFCRMLERPEGKGSSAYHLFQAILASSSEQDISASLLEDAFVLIQQMGDAGSHKACFYLSQWVFEYSEGGADSDDSSSALVLLKLSTLLYKISEIEVDVSLGGLIEELATQLGVLAMSYTSDIDLSVLSVSHLTCILSIAGKQNDYTTLKRILELLWNSRDHYDFNLEPTTTIAIGKRLAEVHFACGEHNAAFTLLEDISYNLKDVYGANHSMAMSCMRLLASMHESLGHRTSAIDVRFLMLKDAATWEDDLTSPGSQDEAVAFYLDQLQFLRNGYATVGQDYSWHLEQNMDYLEEITSKVKQLISVSTSSHDVGDILDLDTWAGLGEVEVNEDALDVWCAPEDWRVEMGMEDDDDSCAYSTSSTNV
ncbi:hypothetical protein NW765_010605 [Fusarium oxysporum]|nr:hypothetical protein FOWG_04187 [Fusarium oxysporum f. sp. lycopersici MN25]KAJ4117189.1 hypothetical protein NW765_010605 [Fusarium oxysporum]KAJ4273273.1 hypothetical protein NW764_012523 [Fusarium oxysporum]